jgi:hypothetical protein
MQKKFKEGIQNSNILLNYTHLFIFIFSCTLRFAPMTITFAVSALTNTPMRSHVDNMATTDSIDLKKFRY